MKYIKLLAIAFFIAGATISFLPAADNFDSIKSTVREKTLANGMKFIVLEQHDVPVVSFHLYADVGSAQEVDGITGISHLLEHLAFKGTKTVGTTDYDAESKILDESDRVYAELTREKFSRFPNQIKVDALAKKFNDLEAQAKEYVVNNEYFDLVMREGDNKANAYTSNDATQYVNSLPSNNLEFWMALSSDRFLNPVFRDFYKEKNVVMEERRLSLENRPQRKLLEDFFSTAFKAHPYRHSVLGHMSDIVRITRPDVKEYFKKYYSPNHLTAAIVGDINADEVFRFAEIYFGRIPAGPDIEPLRTIEPVQWGERHVEVKAQAEPMIFIGYHRPSVNHPDSEALEALASIMGDGRSSRLYERLVKKEQKALSIGSDATLPGGKYPTLIVFYAVPNKGTTSAASLQLIDSEIDRLKKEPVTQEELQAYKTNAKKDFIDKLKSNSSMAALLTRYDVVMGDWRSLFTQINRIDKITPDDIKRVANLYLKSTNRTIGEIVPENNKKGN